MPKSGISRNCGHILRAANSYTLPDQVNGKLAHREIVNWLKVKGKSEGVAKHHCSEVMWSKKDEYFEKLRENNAATNKEGVPESSIARTAPFAHGDEEAVPKGA